MIRHIRYCLKSMLGALTWGGTVLACPFLASCIDEDLSKCGVNYTVSYSVRQPVDLGAEVRAVLSAPAEQGVAADVEAALGGVFAGTVHDLDLPFYDVHMLEHRQAAVIDAARATMTFYMQKADYRHLPLGNVEGGEPLGIDGADSDLALTLGTAVGDTIPSHAAPVYSGRLDMPLADRDEAYRADLYMVNSAVAVVLADAADGIGAVTGIVDGMATGFAVNDSTFSFDRGQATRMEGMQLPGYHTLYAVTMPSRDALPASADGDGLWQVKVYVDLGGKTTENVLHISEPLRAGRVKIIKGVIKDDGSITTESPEVGVSVTLDWKPGGSHDVEI